MNTAKTISTRPVQRSMVDDHREPLDRLAGALLQSKELDRLEIAATDS
jgi:hypothetical protein